MAGRAAVALAVSIGALACAGPAHASTVVYVCGKNLCRTDQTGSNPVQLTRDGGSGAYSRPTISADGKRVAFKRAERGHAYTARLKRRSLSDVTRIGPAPDGARDATQFDVAISPDGKRVAWVEQRSNVVFGTIDYRRYMANADGSSPRQVASSGGRPFVAFYDATRILREGLTEAVDAMQEGESVDSGICVPSPTTASNGTCRGARAGPSPPGVVSSRGTARGSSRGRAAGAGRSARRRARSRRCADSAAGRARSDTTRCAGRRG